MTLSELIQKIELDIICGNEHLDRTITGGFLSDLLSDVMGNSKEGNLWATIQVHKNIIAVASLKELSAIVLVNNLEPAADTIELAKDEEVVLLRTSLPAFEFAGKLYCLLQAER